MCEEERAFCESCGIVSLEELNELDHCQFCSEEKGRLIHYTPEGWNSDHYLICSGCHNKAIESDRREYEYELEMITYQCDNCGSDFQDYGYADLCDYCQVLRISCIEHRIEYFLALECHKCIGESL